MEPRLPMSISLPLHSGVDVAVGTSCCRENRSVGLVSRLCESYRGESSVQEPRGALDLLFSSPLHENAERRRKKKSMNETGAVGEFAGVCSSVGTAEMFPSNTGYSILQIKYSV